MATSAPASAATAAGAPPSLTRYQRFVTALLTLLQFAVILDFMIMSPLGAMIMPAMGMTAQQFGMVVSAYAFSAGLSGLLTAGFADRFDRKRLLLFFYGGFLLGTLWCGLATSFESLLLARIVTGLFGGVIGSIVMAIAADLFEPALRGRVMGLLQGGFAASQVLGLPFGLYLATHGDWHTPFLALVAFGTAGGLLIAWRMKPVDAHLKLKQERSAFAHLWHTVAQRRHLHAFLITALLTTGGFMIMPFASAFSVHNVGIDLAHLPIVYLVTGISTMFVAPLVGRLADRFGPLPVFYTGSALTIAMVAIYTRLGPSPLIALVAINVVLFAGIFSRMVPWQVVVTGIPAPEQRGAFTAINAALQQLAGGLAALISGHIVVIAADGRLEHFPWVGNVLIGTTLAVCVLIGPLARQHTAERRVSP
ncbi:MFS transporter [Roseateles puraquae]|jgi:predicted MFS family arabinose efflux permease|uniref:MFS transporter n=1 Tax=Roseateles puraquae TaxID=431059 RepID=A0A254MYJ6_9BURK|nr:MFS transporter [Roseateles puraquae]MDG0856145.1 MFS transporter [Roseateles puraquae]OWR00503.1 MFS transporter [Roseateles puraquae]